MVKPEIILPGRTSEGEKKREIIIIEICFFFFTVLLARIWGILLGLATALFVVVQGWSGSEEEGREGQAVTSRQQTVFDLEGDQT